jgi:hypothetical protein
MAGFELVPNEVRAVASVLREGSDLAARAGMEFAALGEGLPAPATGRRLLPALNTLSAGWTAVLDDVVAGLTHLSGWLDEAVTALVAADDEAVGGWSGFPR